MKKRLPYIIGFLLLLGVEVLIALFVRDDFIRPLGGDIIVVWVVYLFVQSIFCRPDKAYHIAVGVLIFAFIVELLQGIGFVHLIGLGDIRFFRILMGTDMAFLDFVCYAVGAVINLLAIFIRRKTVAQSLPKK